MTRTELVLPCPAETAMGLFEKYRNIIESNLDVLRTSDLSAPEKRRETILQLDQQRRYLLQTERHLNRELEVVEAKLDEEQDEEKRQERQKLADRLKRRLKVTREALGNLEQEVENLLRHSGDEAKEKETEE